MTITRFPLNPILSALLGSAALLSACGGGGAGDPVAPPPVAASVKLEGVAAIGRAFEGAMVSVTDSTGKSASMATPVGADGKYVIDVTGLTAPLVVTATGMVGDLTLTLLSVQAGALPANGSVTVGISPLSHALASMLSSSGNPADLKTSDVSADKVAAKIEVLRAAIAGALTSAGLDASTFNPLTAPIVPGTGTGFDQVIASVKVTTDSGGVVLRDALAGDTSLLLTPATKKEDVEGPKSLPAPAPDAPKLSDAVAAMATLEAALNKCFAVGPADRVTLDANGNVDDVKGECLDVGSFFPGDYLNNSYTGSESYGPQLMDARMTAAKWRLDIDRFTKGTDGNDYATLVMRYTRADGLTSNRVDTVRKFPAPQGDQVVGWHMSGNRRPFDAVVNPFLNRTLFTSAERPLNGQGVQTDQFNGNSYYESGIRLFFNPLRHPNVRAVRLTNDKPGGPLPNAGVVLGRANTTLPSGCGRDARMVIANQTGDVNIGEVGFRSNNSYILDRDSVDPAKPISKSAWKPYNDHAAAPITAPIPAYTRYRFEVFYIGNNSATPDATFSAPHIAAVPLAASGSAFKWAEFTADTAAFVKPGVAIDKPVLAWTLSGGALNPTSVYGYSRVSNGTARTQPGGVVATTADRSATLDNSAPAPGCASGASLAELGTSGFGFRGVGMFLTDPGFVRHENALQWSNYQ